MMGHPARLRRCLWLALLIACVVVPLGAYVRLSDAGLGCPDWPGCYGRLSPAHARDIIVDVHAADPHGPVSLAKAWKEMVHRYLASTLGLVVLAIAWLAWRQRVSTTLRATATLLLLGVVAQGLLGMWTVTLLLKPAVVTAHLLGGMGIVALLTVLVWCERLAPVAASALTRGLAWLLCALVLGQIALGGWVSSNYAALVCQGFPACNGEWVPAAMRFDHAFQLTRALGMAPDGTALAFEQMVGIHWLHRVGALLVSLCLLSVCWRARHERGWRGLRLALLSAWVLQLVLGVANVLGSLPLPVAVAHNAGAMLLLALSLLTALRLRPAHRVTAEVRPLSLVTVLRGGVR